MTGQPTPAEQLLLWYRALVKKQPKSESDEVKAP